MKPKILISTSSFGRVGREPLRLLEAAGLEVVLNPHGRKLEAAEVAGLLTGVEGLVAGTEPLGRETLEAAPRLRVISRCGVGMDNVDRETARELGIAVHNTPEAHVAPVAELVLAGMLDLLRRVTAADRALRRGEWKKPMGRLLRGKRVGILGLGRVGRALVGLLEPFECRVLAFDVAPDEAFGERHGVEFLPLEEILPKAEVLSVNLPGGDALHHLLGEAQLRLLPAGALVVNCARGGLVDEAALHRLLVDGRLGGAFLDVFEREPYRGPLAELENVVLTPHMGSYAAEGRLAMETEAVRNLLPYFEGGSKDKREEASETR